MTMTWTHWLLLGRLISGERRWTQTCELHQLEAEGYVFSEGEPERIRTRRRWYPTSLGIRAYQEKLAEPPSWETEK